MRSLFRFPRRFNSSSTKGARLLDECHRMNIKDPKDAQALEAIVGKDWEKVPTRSLMELVSARLCVQPKDYTNEEVGKVVGLLVELGHSMSPEQRRFLAKFDHLPLSINSDQPWMQADELAAYERSNEEIIHTRKTQVFLVNNGIMQAAAQSSGQQPSPKKEKTPIKVHPAIIIVVLVALGALIILFT